ncbi:MAG: RHS repeat-associated core domain-containing protein [Bacteroidia bacterium]
MLDDLQYTYDPSSNHLKKVDDHGVSTSPFVFDGLGDFRDVPASTDYTYDRNGNQLSDANKGMTYAYDVFLNKQTDAANSYGTIKFVYDAQGNKLQKVSNNHLTPVTTEYMGPVIYINKSLDYVVHDEGRVLNTANLASPLNNPSSKYEFYIKDHLGNTRSVVGEVPSSGGKTPVTYLATSEISKTSTEIQLFNNLMTTRSARPLATDTGNVMAAKVGTANPIGPDITLKVMAGDTLIINAEGLFIPSSDPSANQTVASVLQTFISAFAAPLAIPVDGGPAVQLSSTTGLSNAMVNMQQSAANPNSPAAFLNYILYDANMNLIPGGSGAIQISQNAANAWVSLPTQTVSIPQNGFLRVFTSNTSGVDVRFDNMQIVHYKGQLLEEYNYYPYGLIFDQNQAFSGLTQTNYLYNGKELQQNEFGAGGNGLSLYDYGARMYDPQTGRWCGIDQLASKFESWTPFGYVRANPVRLTDPDGREDTDFKDADGKMVKHVEDNSNAVFQQTGTGVNKHYEFNGWDESNDGENKVNLTTAIQEQQNLNNGNSALEPGNGATYCNYATQNVLKTVISGSNNSSGLDITGMANSMTNNFATNPLLIATTQAGATTAAANGNLALFGYNNPNGHGHVGTFSVGENVDKGAIANIGASNGFKAVGPGKGSVFSSQTLLNSVSFYTLSPTVTPKTGYHYVEQVRTNQFGNPVPTGVIRKTSNLNGTN